MAPVARPAEIFVKRDGFSPGFSSPAIKFLTGTYRPILNPANTHYLYNPAVNPLYNALKPSSLEIVAIVPRKPLYLGSVLGSADFD